MSGLPGNMGRKIPKPFARPSISLGEKKVVREWKWQYPGKLESGDILANHGVVIDVKAVFGGYHVNLVVGQPDSSLLTLPADELVFAFTRKD